MRGDRKARSAGVHRSAVREPMMTKTCKMFEARGATFPGAAIFPLIVCPLIPDS
jgi:hypothetical protein